MSISLTSENKGDHLLIISAGVAETKEDLFKHSELVYGELSKYDQRKILIDCLATRFPTNMFSYYQQVKHFSKNLPDGIKLLKIAIALAPEFIDFGNFWETVAVNRGFRYHTFTSLEKAHEWLMH